MRALRFFKILGRASATRRPSTSLSPPPRGPSTSLRANGRGFKNERGVALMIAIISIAVLTAVAVDFAYNSRVDLQLAVNHRDEVRAYYLAKSGIGLSRLLLKFQKQIDNLGGGAGMGGLGDLRKNPAIAGMLPPGMDASSLGPLSGALNLQLWKMARVDCQMLQGMVNADSDDTKDKSKPSSKKFGFDDEFPELGAEMQKRTFGGFTGCFLATIADEEEKLNVNKLDMGALQGQAVVPRFLDLFADKQFEFLYEKEDSNRVKANPADILIAMHDWIDADQVQATLNIAGQPGTDPFLPGFSDENYLYDRYDPRYKAKNASFDTLDELYMVHGVNDKFMAAFKDRLTVYPDINSKLNVNTDDPLLLYMAILSVTDPVRPDYRLRDPIFIDQVIQKIRLARMMSMLPGLGMSVKDFINVVQAAGIQVNSSIAASNSGQNNFVGDKTNTFSIKSVGEAGQVQKTITAVIRADGSLGKLVYWREE